MYPLLLVVTVLVGLIIFASGVFGLIARSKVRNRPGRGQAISAAFRVVAGPVVIVLPLLHW
jgi:uncharacterized membrane protein HdeD (DUF308 family)